MAGTFLPPHPQQPEGRPPTESIMKMLVIIYRASLTEDIHNWLRRQNVKAFTEILSVQGTGESGQALGTLFWPGHNSLLLTAVPDQEAAQIAGDFAAHRQGLQQAQHGADIPMKLFVLPIEHIV